MTDASDVSASWKKTVIDSRRKIHNVQTSPAGRTDPSEVVSPPGTIARPLKRRRHPVFVDVADCIVALLVGRGFISLRD